MNPSRSRFNPLSLKNNTEKNTKWIIKQLPVLLLFYLSWILSDMIHLTLFRFLESEQRIQERKSAEYHGNTTSSLIKIYDEDKPSYSTNRSRTRSPTKPHLSALPGQNRNIIVSPWNISCMQNIEKILGHYSLVKKQWIIFLFISRKIGKDQGSVECFVYWIIRENKNNLIQSSRTKSITRRVTAYQQ